LRVATSCDVVELKRHIIAFPKGSDVTHLVAYLDPGSGTLLLQGLVAGVATAAVMAKVYWRRAKRFLGLGRDEPGEE
jgi:hypothetical protein